MRNNAQNKGRHLKQKTIHTPCVFCFLEFLLLFFHLLFFLLWLVHLLFGLALCFCFFFCLFSFYVAICSRFSAWVRRTQLTHTYKRRRTSRGCACLAGTSEQRFVRRSRGAGRSRCSARKARPEGARSLGSMEWEVILYGPGRGCGTGTLPFQAQG